MGSTSGPTTNASGTSNATANPAPPKRVSNIHKLPAFQASASNSKSSSSSSSSSKEASKEPLSLRSMPFQANISSKSPDYDPSIHTQVSNSILKPYTFDVSDLNLFTAQANMQAEKSKTQSGMTSNFAISSIEGMNPAQEAAKEKEELEAKRKARGDEESGVYAPAHSDVNRQLTEKEKKDMHPLTLQALETSRKLQGKIPKKRSAAASVCYNFRDIESA